MNETSTLRNLKYKYKFFFTLDYLLKKIGVNFTKANVYSFKLDNFIFKESKTDNIVIKECELEDLTKFGELEDLFLKDMQNGHILIAAFLDDQWVGYNWISLKPIEVEEVEKFIHFDGAYLYRAYVKEEYRKMGINKGILYFTLNQIKNKYKKNEAYAITETANVPANRALTGLKFSKVGIINYSRIFLWKKYEEKIENNTVTLLED
ncbi:GNAT family N-acetyltransferase [Methanobacterium sp. ACI-7]|uniref:GNAT family N-acetyltransferase n=1 Tax=unclassified Methanobacterium TaxID=2627676 RepID=UPI0039C0EB45